MTVEDRVRRFLVQQRYWDGPETGLTDDLPLIDERVIDSLGIQRLIAFVERELGVEVDDQDIIVENFATLGRVGAYVRRKAGSAGPARVTAAGDAPGGTADDSGLQDP